MRVCARPVFRKGLGDCWGQQKTPSSGCGQSENETSLKGWRKHHRVLSTLCPEQSAGCLQHYLIDPSQPSQEK
jgi:hypothetical protein